MPSAVVFGSAITSARANGATAFFRGLCRALARGGLQVTFAEESRNMIADGDLPAEVAVRHYATPSDVRQILGARLDPRLVLKFVRCGAMDAMMEETLLAWRQSSDFLLFVDGDAPLTLEELGTAPAHYLRRTLPRFDAALILAGGEAAAEEFRALGVPCVDWDYCAVDEEFWHPVPPNPMLVSDLLFVGNRLPDRDARVQEFFFQPAAACPDLLFFLTGSGWECMDLPPNVHRLGHLSPGDLRQAYSSAGMVLNVNRAPMARYGYAPASRLFEAASCGACILSDRWPGIEELFRPGDEIFIADGTADVVTTLRGLAPATRRRAGLAARRRALQDYTCDTWVKRLFQRLARWGFGAANSAQVVGVTPPCHHMAWRRRS